AEIGAMMADVLDGLVANGPDGNGAVEEGVKARVLALCERFPIYPNH
ncbi:MAG: serine hydroxymethyltransferase, partial [Pacificimonas sp.]